MSVKQAVGKIGKVPLKSIELAGKEHGVFWRGYGSDPGRVGVGPELAL